MAVVCVILLIIVASLAVVTAREAKKRETLRKKDREMIIEMDLELERS